MDNPLKKLIEHLGGLGNETKSNLLKLKDALSQESVQTKDMLKYYALYVGQKGNKDDLEKANKQLRDTLKTLGITTFLVLPGSVITLPALIMLGKKLNIDILPDSFNEQFGSTKDINEEDLEKDSEEQPGKNQDSGNDPTEH